VVAVEAGQVESQQALKWFNLLKCGPEYIWQITHYKHNVYRKKQ
jgi:hypothetical protein